MGLEHSELEFEFGPAETTPEPIEDVGGRLPGIAESGEFDTKDFGVEEIRSGLSRRGKRRALVDAGLAGLGDDAGAEPDR